MGGVIFALGLAVFFGAHLFATFRDRGAGDLRVRLGENKYRGLFSLVSFAGLALIIFGYGELRGLVPIWDPPLWTRTIPMVLMLPAMVLFVAAEAPFGHIKRVVKHPMLAGVKLWAFSHLLANGDLASVLLFGAFLAYAVLARIVAKRRPAVERPAPALKGDVISVVLGVAIYFAFAFWAHAWLIGVPVIG